MIRNETSIHTQAESEFARSIEQFFSRGITAVHLRKLPELDPLDFAVYRGNSLVGYCELKCRTNPMGKYPSFILPLTKTRAFDRKHTKLTPCSLFVRWADCNGYIKYDKQRFGSYDIKMCGRVDRGQPEDIAPHIIIPNEDFTLFAT